jgi:ABC-2 type transport system permease protein
MSQGMEIMSPSLSMLSKDNATLIMVTDPSQTSSSIVKSIIMNFAQSFSNYMIGAKPFMEFEDRAFISKSLKAGDYYLPGYIAAFIMSNGLMGVAQDTAEFKRRGVLKRLATTPLRKLEWVTGNVIAQAILGFLLSGVMILTGYVLYGITVIPNILSIALILAGSMAFSGLALIISGTLEDVEAVASLGSAISFPMMFLSGSFVPLEIMPKYLQTVSQFLPLTYLSNGLRAALITGDESNAIFNLIVILIVGIIAIILGAWLTRWKEK